jgi:hypothetical protein
MWEVQDWICWRLSPLRVHAAAAGQGAPSGARHAGRCPGARRSGHVPSMPGAAMAHFRWQPPVAASYALFKIS